MFWRRKADARRIRELEAENQRLARRLDDERDMRERVKEASEQLREALEPPRIYSGEFLVGIGPDAEFRVVSDDDPEAVVKRGETVTCDAGHEMFDLEHSLFAGQAIEARLFGPPRPDQPPARAFGAIETCKCGRPFYRQLALGVGYVGQIHIKGRGWV